MLEIQTMLVEVVAKFKLEAITKREEIVFVADLILRSKNPIFMKFQLR
jgi:cytochrome P450 family 4